MHKSLIPAATRPLKVLVDLVAPCVLPSPSSWMEEFWDQLKDQQIIGSLDMVYPIDGWFTGLMVGLSD